MENKEKIKCKYDTLIDLHKLVPHPRNANTHPVKQIEMLAKIIDHLGQRHPIIISNLSGFMVAGHARQSAMTLLKWGKAAVEYQDFKDEAEEFAFLIADNKIAELAEHDDAKMLKGIKDLELGTMDFELLGLQNFIIDPLVIDDPDKEWEGMPEFDQDDKTSFRHIIVHFNSEDDALEFFRVIGQSSTAKTKSIWYPPQEKMDTEAKRYAAE